MILVNVCYEKMKGGSIKVVAIGQYKTFLDVQNIPRTLQACISEHKAVTHKLEMKATALKKHGLDRVLEAISICTHIPKRATELDKEIFRIWED